MHPLLRVAYGAAGQLARLAARTAPAGGGKVLASLRARSGITARYAAWGALGRDPSRPLLWVHAPSVGEGLMAEPVVELLRKRHPNLQLAYTFYSPSAAGFARRMGADFSDFLPFDTTADADAALAALRPSALVFSKLDVWPVLVARAALGQVPVGLISATLADGAGRASRLAGLILSDAYRALGAVGVVDSDDANRLTALGVRSERITVTGDTRYDQVWRRTQAVERTGPLLGPLATPGRPTIVAGSTWPSDEEPLLAAWRAVHERVPAARLVIAPHEPTEPHLLAVEQWAGRTGARLARLGAPSARDADVLLVDRVGVLADLYALADVAYVGGGFHAAGLHSVVEPAAFGVPVLFGPRHTSSRDARLLLDQGGGFAASSAQEIGMRLLALLTEPAARTAAGVKARAVVESGLGAAERSAQLVESLLQPQENSVLIRP